MLQQAISWTSDDQYQWFGMASPGYNELWHIMVKQINVFAKDFLIGLVTLHLLLILKVNSLQPRDAPWGQGS